MPGTERLDAPSILHHVMIRGIERRIVLLGDQPVSLDMARLLLGTNDVPGQILIAPTTGFLRLGSFLSEKKSGYHVTG
jgi:hypothetical protein